MARAIVLRINNYRICSDKKKKTFLHGIFYKPHSGIPRRDRPPRWAQSITKRRPRVNERHLFFLSASSSTTIADRFRFVRTRAPRCGFMGTTRRNTMEKQQPPTELRLHTSLKIMLRLSPEYRGHTEYPMVNVICMPDYLFGLNCMVVAFILLRRSRLVWIERRLVSSVRGQVLLLLAGENNWEKQLGIGRSSVSSSAMIHSKFQAHKIFIHEFLSSGIIRRVASSKIADGNWKNNYGIKIKVTKPNCQKQCCLLFLILYFFHFVWEFFKRIHVMKPEGRKLLINVLWV